MTHEQLDDLLAVFHAAGVNLFPEHILWVRIMQPLIEFEIRVLPRLVHRPAGEAARDFGDVFLRIAAVHTECVQFHQFASIIFVEPALIFLRGLLRIWSRTRRPRPAESSAAPLLPRSALRGLRIGAQEVVQVKKHRRTFRRRGQKIFEFPQRVWLQPLALAGWQGGATLALARKYMEFV